MLKKENILPFIQEGLLMVFVAFVCLLGGTELVYRNYMVQVFALGLGVIFLLRLLFKLDTGFCYPAATIFMIFFLVIILLQCASLPMNIIRLLSPNTAILYDKFMPLGSQNQWRALSVYIFSTQAKLIEMVALFSLFFVTVNTIRTKQQIKLFIIFCIGIAVFLSLLAAVKGHFLSGGAFSGFGSFSNRNYYAGFMLLMSFLCIGYGFSLREFSQRVFFLFLAGILVIGVCVSIARAAIASLFFWFCFMILWFIQQKLFNKERMAAFTLFVVLLITLYFTVVNPGPLLAKLETTSRSLAGRFVKYSAAFSMIKDFPLLGVGFGNYRYVFTRYSNISMIMPDPHVHSDPLQVVVENGIVGSIFLCLFFISIFKEIVAQLYKRHDPFIKCIVLSGLCGLFALISHSFLEVLFPIPAISFMFWFVMALIYKAVYIHSDVPKNNL